MIKNENPTEKEKSILHSLESEMNKSVFGK